MLTYYEQVVNKAWQRGGFLPGWNGYMQKVATSKNRQNVNFSPKRENKKVVTKLLTFRQIEKFFLSST